MIEIQLNQGKVALVDEADYALVSGITWTANNQAHLWYATNNDLRLKMHRVIMAAPANMHVDHINGDGLDNRRQNLRLATRYQNAANRRKFADGNRKYRSRYKGVRPDHHKFGALVSTRGKRIYIGSFKTEIEAAQAYDRKARELFGEFASLNFPEDL